MINWLSTFLLSSLLQISEQEAHDFIRNLPPPTEVEAAAFIGNPTSIEKQEENLERKCTMNVSPLPADSSQLFVFISFSVPLETWKEHSYFLKKLGGTFVLRGLPDNSFEMLSQKLLELRQAGIDAPVILDPPLFEAHEITMVPSIVLLDKEDSDKVAGNIKIFSALSIFSENGVTKKAAKELLNRLEMK